MRTRDRMAHGTVLLVLAAAVIALPCAAQTSFGIGHVATPEQIAGWNIDVEPDGRNFPQGHGTIARGKEVYATHCASCHGDKGEGGIGDRLVGGIGTLSTDKPIKTVGSYWPYATTLFDYIRRAMPLNAPESLSNDDVYAVSGYVLYMNGLLNEDATVNGQVLTALHMPNRAGFVGDPRPDVHDRDCMKDCSHAKRD